MNIEKLITEAPGQPDFTNNAWIVGDDREVIVIDPAHQPDRIALAVDQKMDLTVVRRFHRSAKAPCCGLDQEFRLCGIV